MFTPRDLALERGWPGRIDADHVVQLLAAQTLEAFFTGGGSVREHAVWPVEDVRRLSCTRRPCACSTARARVRVREPGGDPHPDEEVVSPEGADGLVAPMRPTAVIGADGAIGGFTTMRSGAPAGSSRRRTATSPPTRRPRGHAGRVGRRRLRLGGRRRVRGPRPVLRPGDLVAANPGARLMRVAVVGAGVVGLATASEPAAPRAHDVTVLEQFEVGHNRGPATAGRASSGSPTPSSNGCASPRRRCGSGASSRPRPARTLALTGLVELEPRSAEALAACGIPYEELDAATLAERFGVRARAGATPPLQPEAGYLRADRANRAFLEAARSRGVTVVDRTRIDRLDDADADVVTAGAWARPLLALSGIEPLSRRRARRWPTSGSRPTGSRRRSSRSSTAGTGSTRCRIPSTASRRAGTAPGSTTNLTTRGASTPAIVDEVAVARTVFELADPEPVGAETCLYTNTADERFVLERHGRIVVGSACSGHGFKFAPVVGARLADLVEGPVR